MKQFSIPALTKDAYKRFPEACHKPMIGLTGNHSDIDVTLRDAYHKQIVAAGGVPVIIPPVDDFDVISNTLDHLDGLILTGGGDYDPRWCNEEPSPKLGTINAVRDPAELLITRLAYNRNIPMLGICRGMQTLAMALNGHVAQDISEATLTPLPSALIPAVSPAATPAIVPEASASGSTVLLPHSQTEDRPVKTHTVTIAPGSTLFNIYAPTPTFRSGSESSESIATVSGASASGSTAPAATPTDEPITIAVNSFHHQCVDNAGPLFRAVAWAPDGVMEAMESSEHKPILGVQWHPEWLAEDGLPIFQWLTQQATLHLKATDFHKKNITMDTHCDTPMFFHQGVNFLERDPRIKVDLHKMTDGQQDATIMVCYLPQPKEGKTFRESIDFNITTPYEYTDFIFDEIGKFVSEAPDYLAFARNEADLLRNKAEGKKSIILGIENGLAICPTHNGIPALTLTPEEEAESIKRLQHFADRGIVYMTLSHNGDNAICDAASRSNNTHGGVSQFGEKIIHQLNALGIMVDLSHGGEKSFYDALDISHTPIVCSHSNCRSLCDHQRNLTDDQLRALAAKGGVAHTTFYPGFLNKAGEADITDAIRHLNHAIDIMGIDHVGIGTDFDGDGGVPGMNDASDALNFTMHLLRNRFSDSDIRKIWGGNWLRLMNYVQSQSNENIMKALC